MTDENFRLNVNYPKFLLKWSQTVEKPENENLKPSSGHQQLYKDPFAQL